MCSLPGCSCFNHREESVCEILDTLLAHTHAGAATYGFIVRPGMSDMVPVSCSLYMNSLGVPPANILGLP